MRLPGSAGVLRDKTNKRNVEIGKASKASKADTFDLLAAWKEAADFYKLTAEDMRGRLYISTDNKKLQKTGTVSFNLPAGFTCAAKAACGLSCYALRGHFNHIKPARVRVENLYWLIMNGWDKFAEVMPVLLDMLGHTSLRWHDSGEFMNQEHVDACSSIARQVGPKMRFYAYTKMFHRLDFSYLPDNFHIVQSEGGKDDKHIDYSKPHARVFRTVEDLEAAGYVNGSVNDAPALNAAIKIGLVWH